MNIIFISSCRRWSAHDVTYKNKMAKKKKTTAKKNKGASFLSRLQSESGASSSGESISLGERLPNIESTSITKFLGAVIFLFGVLFVFALFGSGGYVGTLLLNGALHTLGFFGYLSFLYFWFIGYCIFTRSIPAVPPIKLISGVGFVLAVTALFNVENRFENIDNGGLIGNILGLPFYSLFSYYPALLFLLLLTVYCLLVVTGIEMSRSRAAALRDKMSFLRSLHISPSFLSRFKRSPSDYAEDEDEEYYEEDESSIGTDDIRSHILKTPKPRKTTPTPELEDEEYEDEEEIEEEESPKKRAAVSKPAQKKQTFSSAPIRDFTPPPLSLLQRDSGKASVGDTKTNMSVIKRTLSEFGIQVEMDEVSIGPSVTRYALKPAQGVKLSRIANHRQELAYALRAESIRIEAPIPGKALVGIEIPNETKSMVGLASLFSAPGWDSPDKPLLVALGKGISGTPLFSNLAKMPHLLIAGTTGSGKSVMVHTIINSLIFRNSPQDLKFIMVDPKKVELTLYNNIPHLYTPVITNPKLTIRTLNWAVNEMERRYDRLEEEGVRDIGTYHSQVYKAALKKNKEDVSDLPERMPYIVIIIDELADIMMSYPKELEAAIVRLAQKSRAVGIHLILSTQRPSVNVITGLIKANIPSRIALKVASQVDSRTIIDTAGAEQLLGQGDLLFTSSESPKQERVQSAFVSDGEVKRVVDYLKQTYRDMVPEEINIETAGNDRGMQTLFGTELGSVGGGDTDDDLFEQAREIVISSRKASTSYLQRRLKIGYSRAARLMDLLEERGIIGPGDGAKPREVLVGEENGPSDFDEVSEEE